MSVKPATPHEASAYLRTFLDEDSKALFDSVTVGEDYSLQVLDRHKNPHLANISAGQRQLVSMAFITALAKIAAGGELLEMPLFMDTPFGRLSFDHRCSLIDNIPELCAQWILLATDTELRQPEAQRLLDTGRWGVFYQLKASGTGETAVEKMIPQAAIRSLKRAIERKR